MIYINIETDTNDADYAALLSKIDADFLQKIEPLISAIKNFKPYKSLSENNIEYTHNHNWPKYECLREDLGEKNIYEIYSSIDKNLIDEFDDLVPTSEYGCHTIKSIEVLYVSNTNKLI